MDLVCDMCELVRNTFNYFGIDYYDPEKTSNQSKRLKGWLKKRPNVSKPKVHHQILRQHVNLNKKLIDTIPRKVFVSPKIVNSSSPKEIKDVAELLKVKLEAGGNVNPYQSKGILAAYEEDQLLSSWRIYHFHLNDSKTEDNFFMDRSDWLLMGFIEFDSAYLLDIRQHSEKDENGDNLVWSRQEMIEIITGDFPEAVSKYKLNAVLSSDQKFTDAEIKQVREAGINMMPGTDDNAFVPMGGGIATDGSSMEVTMRTHRIMKMIYDWENYLNENSESLIEDFAKYGLVADEFSFRLGLDDNGFFVFEEKTGGRPPQLNQQSYMNPAKT